MTVHTHFHTRFYTSGLTLSHTSEPRSLDTWLCLLINPFGLWGTDMRNISICWPVTVTTDTFKLLIFSAHLPVWSKFPSKYLICNMHTRTQTHWAQFKCRNHQEMYLRKYSSGSVNLHHCSVHQHTHTHTHDTRHTRTHDTRHTLTLSHTHTHKSFSSIIMSL